MQKKSIKMTKFSEHNFKQKYSSQNTKNGILEDQDFCKILRRKITLRPPLVAHPFRARVIPRLLKISRFYILKRLDSLRLHHWLIFGL